MHEAFKDNIWGADLVDMQLLSRYKKRIGFLLCVIDIFSKYAWVVSLKDKKGLSIVTAFQSILKQSNRRAKGTSAQHVKPNKIWVDKGSEFYNASFNAYKMSKYFPPYNNSSENIKVELDLSNYATKKDVKDITHIDASGFSSKTNLAALKTEDDKIDTDKLKTVPDDAGRTKFEIDGRANYDKIDAVEKKIPVLTDFVTTPHFNHEKKLLATKTALTTVENKTPDVSTLATKTNLTITRKQVHYYP